jgi:predicted acetyltransferase
MLKLVDPDLKYKFHYIEMMEQWRLTCEIPVPWVLQMDYSDMCSLIKNLKDLKKGIGVPQGLVPCSAYWGYDDETDKLIGAIDVRHYLNSHLYNTWGYIEFGVRPDERKKGYATGLLKLALEKCRNLPVKKVLLGCYKANEACVKVIIKNGGILENEFPENKTGRLIQRYWVGIKG